jgi:hypothetical protein
MSSGGKSAVAEDGEPLQSSCERHYTVYAGLEQEEILSGETPGRRARFMDFYLKSQAGLI